jgi:hypothetical protein
MGAPVDAQFALVARWSARRDEVFDLAQFADRIFAGAYMPTAAYGFEMELAQAFIGILYKSGAGYPGPAFLFRTYTAVFPSISYLNPR